MQFPEFFNQKGIAIALVIAILSVMLSAALGMGAVLYGQAKVMSGMGDSVVALYAADSGIEEALTDEIPSASYSGAVGEASYSVDVVCCVWNDPDCSLDNGECTLFGLSEDVNCDAAYFCYDSVGTYRGAKRAIEILR